MKELALGIAFFFCIALAAFAQDAVSRSQRSMLQPEQEAAAQLTGLDESKYFTDNWGRSRT